MKPAPKRSAELGVEPVRVLGRGLRAQRGVHLSLRTLREASGKTQGEVRAASGIDQADISRLESRESFGLNRGILHEEVTPRDGIPCRWRFALETFE